MRREDVLLYLTPSIRDSNLIQSNYNLKSHKENHSLGCEKKLGPKLEVQVTR